MLKVLFYSKVTKPVVPFFRFITDKNVLFKFIKALHYFTLVTAYDSKIESKKFLNFFKK